MNHQMNRKNFIKSSSALGLAAATTKYSTAAPTNTHSDYPEMTVFPKKVVKSVIYLHMVGGPSQMDLFDHKPLLNKMDGQKVPKSLFDGNKFAFLKGDEVIMGSPYQFKRHGQSGLELCNLWKYLPEVADDITMVKSMHTDQFNHGPAQVMMQTGFGRFGRPCMGSWINFGIGSDNPNLPGFVVLQRGDMPGAGASLWSSGFLPGQYQGIKFLDSSSPVHFLTNPNGINHHMRSDIVKAINTMNQESFDSTLDPDIQTRMIQYKLANRMQNTMPEVADISNEPNHIKEMYGEGFGKKCLLARRLVERGTRFIQLYDSGWDTHKNIDTDIPNKVREVDQGTTALIKDLKQRGMLDETLVIFGGEFGRTSMMQGRVDKNTRGRDHQIEGFCTFFAGGPFKRGFTFGKTDELALNIVEKPMHIHDFHATVLHAMGIDHRQLIYRFQGRDFRLTDIGGRIFTDLYS